MKYSTKITKNEAAGLVICLTTDPPLTPKQTDELLRDLQDTSPVTVMRFGSPSFHDMTITILGRRPADRLSVPAIAAQLFRTLDNFAREGAKT